MYSDSYSLGAQFTFCDPKITSYKPYLRINKIAKLWEQSNTILFFFRETAFSFDHIVKLVEVNFSLIEF